MTPAESLRYTKSPGADRTSRTASILSSLLFTPRNGTGFSDTKADALLKNSTYPVRSLEADASIAYLTKVILDRPNEIAFMVGCGISIPRPTHLPSGFALSEAALRTISDDFVHQLKSLTKSKVLLAQALGLYVGQQIEAQKGGGVLPRLETVLQAYSSLIGPEIVGSLKFMTRATPNLIHGAIGALCAEGSSVLTSNFDRMIEKCSEQANVLHLHGHVEDPASIRTTIDGITSPLQEELIDKMKNILRGKRMLVVLGYSGGDRFDISPALAAMAETTNLALIWVQHGDTGTPLDRGAHQLLAAWPHYRRAITCDTSRLASLLANRLGVHPSKARPNPNWWSREFSNYLQGCWPNERSRAIAALSVLELMHVGLFTREYRRQVKDLRGLTAQQELAVRRSDSRSACARGAYRLGIQITRQTLEWLKEINGSALDIAEQRLLLVMNLRLFGQGDFLLYLRSIPPLIYAHVSMMKARRRISPRSDVSFERLRTHIWTDWVQFLWRVGLKSVAGNLRKWVLGFPHWDAEHRLRLMASDHEGRFSKETLEISYDLEIPTALVNAGRAQVEKAIYTQSVSALERKADALVSATRDWGISWGMGRT